MWQMVEGNLRAAGRAPEETGKRDRQTCERWILLGSLLALLATGSPAEAQTQGEVQVTARVLPMVPSRDAALAAATASGVRQTSNLFRVTRLSVPAPTRIRDHKREELIVVVEFLAN